MINDEGNTIYSTAAILGDYDLFIYLYNLANKIKDKDGKNNNKIFSQKVYSSNQIISLQMPEKDNAQLLIDFYKEMNKPLPDISIFREELEKIIEQNLITLNNENDLKENNIQSEFKSNYTHLHNDKILSVLNDITRGKLIKNEDSNYFSINNQYFYDIIHNFTNNVNDSDKEKKEEKISLLGNNIFQYCKSKKYEDFCRFMINENYNLINVCNDLFSLNNENELNYYINQMLYEKDLPNLKNDEDITIFHILAKNKNNCSFYKENNTEKYNISNLFDNLGNTPLYYACEKCNKNFIEYFTNYSFSSNDNPEDKVNYSLFMETKNENTPLKSLYLQLNKKDSGIIKLIIDISISMKKVYILYVVLFLIENYKPSYNEFFSLSFNENINNEDDIRKIIGLYLYYTQELNGSFNQDEFKENNPIFDCIKNGDFLFDILLKEKNNEFNINSKNNEGKNLIHLIAEMKGEKSSDNSLNKKDILNKALEAGCDFDLKDNNEKLPIDYAYSNNDEEIIEILSNEYNKRGLRVPKNNAN